MPRAFPGLHKEPVKATGSIPWTCASVRQLSQSSRAHPWGAELEKWQGWYEYEEYEPKPVIHWHSVMSVLFSYYQFIQLQVCASCNRHWFWTWRILERRSYNLSKFWSQQIKKKTGWRQSLGRQTTGSPSEGNMTLSNMQVQTKW